MSALEVGAVEQLSLTVSEATLDAFAAFCGDTNPLHMDGTFAAAHGFATRVSHGAILVAAISALIGTKLPGPGALWRRLQIDWTAPVFPGDTVSLSALVKRVSGVDGSAQLAITGENQNGLTVLRATAVVGLVDGKGSSDSISSPSADGASVAGRGHTGGVVLVSGASRGIGAAIAEKLAAAGHRVLCGYHRSHDAVAAVVSRIEQRGGSALPVVLDVSDLGVAAEQIDDLRRSQGSLVGVVHAATPDLPFEKAAEADWTHVDGLLRAYVGWGLLAAQRVVADAAGREGRVVFIGTSYLHGPPPPKMLAYVTAKSALWGLTKALAAEFGSKGTTVNMVSPSMVQTDLVRHLSERHLLAEARKSATRTLTTADDVAALVGFLFSEAAQQITGAEMPCAGGAVMP